MHRLFPRLSRILLASAFVVPAIAVAEPPPTPLKTPAAPTPVPMPYPLLAATTQTLEAKSVSWGPVGGRLSSDPEEGGEIAHRKAGSDGNPLQEGATVYSADPQEGGQVYSADPEEGGEIVRDVDSAATATAKPKAKPHVSDINVMKSTDTASPMLSSARRDPASGLPTGKRMHKPLVALADPLPAGTATVVVARGACVKGQHIPEVKLTTRARVYQLHDVDVAGCTATADDTDTCTLTYTRLVE